MEQYREYCDAAFADRVETEIGGELEPIDVVLNSDEGAISVLAQKAVSDMLFASQHQKRES
jgi:hypothetical protein